MTGISGSSYQKKYTQVNAVDRIHLVLAHLDCIEGGEGGSHHADFRLSAHDLKAPNFEGDSAGIEMKVSCPYCKKMITFSARGSKVYQLKAREEKTQVLSILQKRYRKVSMLAGGLLGAFVPYMFIITITGSFLSLGIPLLGAMIGIVGGILHARKKFYVYLTKGTNLFVSGRNIKSLENEMDSGPYVKIAGLSIKNPDAFNAGGHRIVVDALIGTTQFLNEVTTQSTDCALGRSFLWEISDLDENVDTPI